MLEKLKRKWKVNTIRFILIICTFAIGGSLCGYLGRRLMDLTGLEKGFLWVLLYIIMVTLVWPLCVILVSIPMGQFNFFKQYLIKLGRKMSGKKENRVRVAIFASGAGSNAQKIIDRFRQSATIEIALIVCNKEGAGVLGIAARENIPGLLTSKKKFEETACLEELKEHGIDFIVLAGFLLKVPPALVNAYAGRIVNIHPALLPKYGGKGMYGHYVHEAVIAAGEKESGITIHYVDEIYDHGKIIFQGTCAIEPGDTPALLAQKIHLLEHEHYPRVIEELLQIQNRR
ncbi:MAG: phosphoribosylglycinamide formyltransferase [Ferruginibacter sp.]